MSSASLKTLKFNTRHTQHTFRLYTKLGIVARRGGLCRNPRGRWMHRKAGYHISAILSFVCPPGTILEFQAEAAGAKVLRGPRDVRTHRGRVQCYFYDWRRSHVYQDDNPMHRWRAQGRAHETYTTHHTKPHADCSSIWTLASRQTSPPTLGVLED